MENIPVINLDELLPIEQKENIQSYSITKLLLPQKPIDTYRIYYKDGSFEDVTAENAYSARAASSKDGVLKITTFKASYSNILKKTNEHKLEFAKDKLSIPLAKNDRIWQFEDLAENGANINFEILDIDQYSQLFKKSNQE
jgi:hypothetical protein